jgi:ABC-type iron transport system FetAB ATPase subunit
MPQCKWCPSEKPSADLDRTASRVIFQPSPFGTASIAFYAALLRARPGHGQVGTGFAGCGKRVISRRVAALSGFYETAVEFKGILMFFYS